MHESNPDRDTAWPALDGAEWIESVETLHMWTQIVGKIRLAQSPWVNHSWHVTLYTTPRGLTTSPMAHGSRSFQIDFDFVEHDLTIRTDEGDDRTIGLGSMATAEFYSRLMAALEELRLPVTIHPRPNEVEDAIPFAENRKHATYHSKGVNAFWRALQSTDRVMKEFRARFTGKVSPVHFFWGSFDHAVTRFSGRPAPEHPGGFPNMPDDVTREAYSHEVSSAGLWPGGPSGDAFFYSYAYPTPEGFRDEPVGPSAATWHADLGEFVLPYSAIRESANPEADLLEFFESTYQAAVRTAGWDAESFRQTFVPRGRRS